MKSIKRPAGVRAFLKKIGVARLVFAVFVLGGAVSGILLFALFRTLPSVEQIESREVVESSKIYDRTGTVILFDINAGEKRTVVPFSELPAHLKNATIALEDEHFYTESAAFSIKGILRALLVNVRFGSIEQGGSTITQQLAKNAFLTPEQTIVRKAKELLLAMRINRHYSKDQILELYLNEIPYGSTFYGAESAAQAYFGKSVRDTTLFESAILAALPQAPSYYSPWGTHVSELLERGRYALKRMYELGKITEEEYLRGKKEAPRFAPQSAQGIKAPHFVFSVQDYLVSKYGEALVRTGGLRVQTTLDWNLQQTAEKVVREGAEQNERLYGGTNAALVAEDSRTGQILALVGSRDYFDRDREGNFNVATQGLRQPGSALKPFVYLAGFMKGYAPETALFDVPTEFSAYASCPPIPDFRKDDDKCFHPENFDGRFRGPVSLRKALAESINIPAVKMLYLVGLPDALRVLQSFGLSTLTDPARYGLSLVLGGGEIRLIDLVRAYSVLSQDGVLKDQIYILEVKDRSGNVLEKFEEAEEGRVVDAQYPRMINDILSDPEARAGLFERSLSLTVFPDHDVALKTGTSNDYRDAWTVGYTPSLVVGVWAGNNNNSPMHRQGSSILAAIPIWNKFMTEALAHEPSLTFPKPETLPASKPVLRGNYLPGNQIHSILYYIKREDPAGPEPENPLSDSQFLNWEVGVLEWAKNNLSALVSAGSSFVEAPFGTSAPLVVIKNPAPGSFYSGQTLQISASISSGSPIKTIRMFWNGALVQSFEGSFGSVYELNYAISPSFEQQNLLVVEVVNESGTAGRSAGGVY